MRTAKNIIEKVSKNPEGLKRLLRARADNFRPYSSYSFSGILMHTKTKGTNYHVTKFYENDGFTVEMSPVRYVEKEKTYHIGPIKYHNWAGIVTERTIKKHNSMRTLVTLHDFIELVEDGQTVTIDGALKGIAFSQPPTGDGEHEILFLSWIYEGRGRCARFNEEDNDTVEYDGNDFYLIDCNGQETRIAI